MSKRYFLLLLAFLFVNCKKSSVNPFNQNLVGQWQLNYAIGGQTGKDIVRPVVGTKTVFVFKNNQTYQRVVNDQIQEQGSYELSQIKSYFTGQNDNAIKFGNSSLLILIEVQKDTLTLSPNAPDAYASIYGRIK